MFMSASAVMIIKTNYLAFISWNDSIVALS